MYHVSAQGVGEHMVNVHYYYYLRGGNCTQISLISMNVMFAHCTCTVISASVATLHASVHRYRSVFLVEFKFGYDCTIRNDP